MTSQPIDYAALAEQARQQSAPKVDYAALADQARSGKASAPEVDEQGEETTPQDRAKNQAYGSLPLTTKMKLLFIPGKMDEWSKQFYGGELDPHGPSSALGKVIEPTLGQMSEGTADVLQGDIAKGGHKIIKSGALMALPLMTKGAIAAPLTAAKSLAAGYLAGKAGAATTGALGGNEDQQQFAGDIGNIAGGAAGAGGPKMLPYLAKAAGKVTDVVDPDLIGLFSPRVAHGLKWLDKAAQVADKFDAQGASGLGDIVDKHSGKIEELSAQLKEALAKANALPPGGPTAQFKNVPDLRVQPSQQAPRNLLDQRIAAIQAQRGAQGEFQIPPPEVAGPSAVLRNVQGQQVSASQGNLQNVNPSVLKATGQQPAMSGRATPNMEIYNEQIPPPKFPAQKLSLIDQLRQWDQIRQIHTQLEKQIGEGQEEVQQWMEDHNQQAPGAKKSSLYEQGRASFEAKRAAAESKAKAVNVDEPQVPTEDTMEILLKKSIQKAQARKAMSAKAGDD